MGIEPVILKKQWDRMSGLPGGKRLFSKAVGVFAPYTGTISAQIDEMRPGHARARLKDRRGVRNHLKSIHAIALVNLAELTGNLALIAGLPDDARFIVTGISIEYLKKARGEIVAIADAEVPTSSEKKEIAIQVRLENKAGDVVARAVLKSLVGPITPSASA